MPGSCRGGRGLQQSRSAPEPTRCQWSRVMNPSLAAGSFNIRRVEATVRPEIWCSKGSSASRACGRAPRRSELAEFAQATGLDESDASWHTWQRRGA